MFTTDDITDIRVTPTPFAGLWRVSFASTHDGPHQLYVNGALADLSDSPAQRSFLVEARDGWGAVAVAAVDEGSRALDQSHLLPSEVREPSWAKRVRIIRRPNHRPGDLFMLMKAPQMPGGEGEILAAAHPWPQTASRWGWGDDLFGAGAFGFDGALAPGFGVGAFGAGPWGFDETLIVLAATLNAPGEQRLILRTLGLDGQAADIELEPFSANPPPEAARTLRAAAYDPVTDTLTLHITR